MRQFPGGAPEGGEECMAKRRVTLGRALEVLSSGRSSFAQRDERVVVRVHVDATCPRAVAAAVRDALVAERPGGIVDVRGLTAAPDGSEAADVALVLVGEGPCAALARAYAGAGVPVALVAEGALDVPPLELGEQTAPLVGIVAGSSEGALLDGLAAWLARSADKTLALAANFPFCRRAVTDALVARRALENAAVGAVSLIPGSDYPIMCASQCALALDIAAAYGREVDLERLAELVGVMGGGVAYRSLARALVGLVPGLGAILKACVGYGGTVATARAIRLRLELEDEGRAGRPAGDAAPAPSGPASQALPATPPADDYVTIGGGAA